MCIRDSINIASAYLQVLFNQELHTVALGQVKLSNEKNALIGNINKIVISCLLYTSHTTIIFPVESHLMIADGGYPFKYRHQGSHRNQCPDVYKRQELKELLLKETPWLADALDETERKRNIAL